MTDLSTRLRIAREESGLKQKDIAKALGIRISTISNYENGWREPDLSTLTKLADLYEVNMEWLLRGDDYESKTKVSFSAESVNIVRIPVIKSLNGYNEKGLTVVSNPDNISFYLSIGKNMIPRMGGNPLGYRILDDKMYPRYMEGDIALVLYNPVILNGEVYLLLTPDNELLIARLFNNGMEIDLEYSNVKYPSVKIPKKGAHVIGPVISRIG